MLKNISQLEHKIEDRVYHLFADSNSPLNEVKEALFEFVKFVGKLEDNAKSAQAEQSKSEEKPADSVVEQEQSIQE